MLTRDPSHTNAQGLPSPPLSLCTSSSTEQNLFAHSLGMTLETGYLRRFVTSLLAPCLVFRSSLLLAHPHLLAAVHIATALQLEKAQSKKFWRPGRSCRFVISKQLSDKQVPSMSRMSARCDMRRSSLARRPLAPLGKGWFCGIFKPWRTGQEGAVIMRSSQLA